MDYNNVQPSANQNVYMYTCHGGSNQKWEFIKKPVTKNDAACIRSKLTYGARCMDYNYNNGNVYMHDECSGSANQKWYFDGDQLKTLWDDDLCFDSLTGGSMKKCDGSVSQQFVFRGTSIGFRSDDPTLKPAAWNCLDHGPGDNNIYVGRCFILDNGEWTPIANQFFYFEDC